MTHGYFCDTCGIAFKIQAGELEPDRIHGGGPVLHTLQEDYCPECAIAIKGAINNLKLEKKKK